MDRHQIAEALRETGVLLKAKGENSFKAKAYISAARAIERTQSDVETLVREERLTTLPGIGKSLARYITELWSTGETRLLNMLREELPPGTAELSQLDGLTLKRIRKLNSELNVSTIAQLEEACKSGKLEKVKGFGIKLQNDILQSISSVNEGNEQLRLINAIEVADDLVEFLRGVLKTERVEIGGTIRRWQESVDKITIVLEADKVRALRAMKKYRATLSIEETEEGLIVLLSHGVPAEIFCVQNLALGLVLHTGSSEHVSHLRAVAREKGYELTDTELRNGKVRVKFTDEADVFDALGLSFIPPEIREGRGEVELAKTGDFRELLEIEDIRGMTHCHTTYSDGVNSVEQMAMAAQKMGMDYITITDHSPTAHYAGGLPIDTLKQQWEEIDRVQEKVRIRILKGTECDILSDGKLDYPDEILEKFDVVIASIHSRYRQNEEQMTRRLLAALRNPYFKIWGHPLGRLVLKRDPIPCDVRNILEAIAGARVAIEINGDPYRLDLAPKWAEIARQLGLKFVISTDAHARGDLQNLNFGIHMARRAKIRTEDVLNTLSVDRFVDFVRVK